uniref:ATP synthase F1 subunit gamma n=1 Tax=Eukaryota sp. BB2 TaxID=1949062 RepID=A0A1W5QGR8_9EUKA|nr:ATP synthase F1 subunit gamma [Eukaryota sp. BB2]AQL10430.1 ATP synthase F1 subunit gamma [Eukaryota sp. BB2]
MSLHKKLKVQLGSYERLYELTQAIQLVALSKLKIAQDIRKKENDSLSSLKKLFSISQQLKYAGSVYLLMPVTSDKSCCGSINTNILDELFNYILFMKELNKDYIVFLIGKKGKNFLQKNCGIAYVKNVSNLSKESISLLTTTIISEKVYNFTFDRCVILFNHLYSVFEQGPAIYEVLSYAHFVNNLHLKRNEGVDTVFWSSILDNVEGNIYFTKDLYDFCFALILLKAFRENELSELGGRITAMQNASKNALEIIQRLRLQFNKARQSYITNELIEIVSCLNALEM